MISFTCSGDILTSSGLTWDCSKLNTSNYVRKKLNKVSALVCLCDFRSKEYIYLFLFFLVKEKIKKDVPCKYHRFSSCKFNSVLFIAIEWLKTNENKTTHLTKSKMYSDCCRLLLFIFIDDSDKKKKKYVSVI